MSSKITVNHVSASEGQLLVFSGSQADSGAPNPAHFGDTNFWVSGSASSQGRADHNPGTAVFGGDLVVSGGIYHIHDPKMINRTGNMAMAPGYGDIIKIGSTVGMIPGSLYFWKNNVWTQTDASDQVNGGMEYLLGIAAGDSSARNGVMIRGFVAITVDSAVGADTGAPVYVASDAGSDSAGDITKTAPSSANDFVRVLGWIVDVDPAGHEDNALIYFSPSQDWIEL